MGENSLSGSVETFWGEFCTIAVVISVSVFPVRGQKAGVDPGSLVSTHTAKAGWCGGSSLGP